MCYICGGSRVCVSSVEIGGDGGGGQCVTSVVAAVPVCPLGICGGGGVTYKKRAMPLVSCLHINQ